MYVLNDNVYTYSWIEQACQFWLGLQLINQKVSEALDSIFPGVHTPKSIAEPVRKFLRSILKFQLFLTHHTNRPTRLLAPDCSLAWKGTPNTTEACPAVLEGCLGTCSPWTTCAGWFGWLGSELLQNLRSDGFSANARKR